MKSFTKRAFVGLMGMSVSLASFGSRIAQNPTAMSRDTLANVVAKFCNNDTVVYKIIESELSMRGTDTLMNASATSKVMLNVTDSTSAGYKIKYTYLDMGLPDGLQMDLPSNELRNDFMSKIVRSVAKQLEGCSIDFTTDENGEIIEITNMDEIKEKSKEISEDIFKNFDKFPFANELKENGIDIRSMLSYLGPELVMKSYLEGVQQMFQCYGKAYDIGTTTLANEEVAPLGKVKTTQNVKISQNGEIRIETDVKSPVPSQVVRQALDSMADGIKNENLRDSMEKAIDEDLIGNGEAETSYEYVFLPSGWPLTQSINSTITMDNIVQVKKKSITRLNF